MDILSKLKIGDKLSIEVDNVGIKTRENEMLNTQLIDKDTKYIYISVPIYKAEKYILSKGQKVTMFFYRKKGVYQFNAQAVKKIESNIITFALKPIGDLKKIQRRDYYRLSISINVILKIYEDNNLIEYKCITKDLSAGGVKLICKDEIKEYKNIVLDIYLDNGQIINAVGEVVRVNKDLENSRYELGIKFKEINENDTDRIFSFIFEKQRLMRKKGLI